MIVFCQNMSIIAQEITPPPARGVHDTNFPQGVRLRRVVPQSLRWLFFGFAKHRLHDERKKIMHIKDRRGTFILISIHRGSAISLCVKFGQLVLPGVTSPPGNLISPQGMRFQQKLLIPPGGYTPQFMVYSTCVNRTCWKNWPTSTDDGLSAGEILEVLLRNGQQQKNT